MWTYCLLFRVVLNNRIYFWRYRCLQVLIITLATIDSLYPEGWYISNLCLLKDSCKNILRGWTPIINNGFIDCNQGSGIVYLVSRLKYWPFTTPLNATKSILNYPNHQSLSVRIHVTTDWLMYLWLTYISFNLKIRRYILASKSELLMEPWFYHLPCGYNRGPTWINGIFKLMLQHSVTCTCKLILFKWQKHTFDRGKS